jgi:hypothetical protein
MVELLVEVSWLEIEIHTDTQQAASSAPRLLSLPFI